MKSKWIKLLATLFALALVAAACGSDTAGTAAEAEGASAADAQADAEEAEEEAEEEEAMEDEEEEEAMEDEDEEAMEDEDAMADGDFAGQVIQVTGPENAPNDWNSIQAALDHFNENTGAEAIYTGSVNWEQEINVQIAAGNPPDISVFPQPGKLAEFAEGGSVVPLTDDVNTAIAAEWAQGQLDFGNVDGVQFGVPVKTDLKSIVWYDTDVFDAGGYDIPETQDALLELTNTMIADGVTPWCVGIESGGATGWLFTDWTEELIMRDHGVEVYDDWVTNDVPFSDERIVQTMQNIVDLWSIDGAVNGGIEAVPSVNHSPGEDLANGSCAMVRQASFFATRLPEGTDNIGWFYFPANDASVSPVLVAGTLTGAFNDDPATMALMEFMGSSTYANLRQEAQREAAGGGISGFNTANQGADRTLWSDIGGEFLEFLQGAETVRFDGSDLMPADVGAGEFWTQATALVNGDVTATEAAAAIDAAWPTE